MACLGGTQTWVKTMASELTRLGHEVHIFAGDGKYDLLPNYPRLDDNYDLALINHNVCLSALEGISIKKRIFTSHGIIPELERPIKGADVYVAVSEEVADHHKGFGFVVIRNPIDTETFTASTISEKLQNVLFMSNYQGDALTCVTEASRGLNLRVIGKDNKGDALENMRWADLVIALGRTALEAMSMGRNVIVYDYNGADGFVNTETIEELRKNNCSGRRYGLKLSPNDLKRLFSKYDPNLNMRNYVLNNNNVATITQEYLHLYAN
jgi:hypothetical protein